MALVCTLESSRQEERHLRPLRTAGSETLSTQAWWAISPILRAHRTSLHLTSILIRNEVDTSTCARVATDPAGTHSKLYATMTKSPPVDLMRSWRSAKADRILPHKIILNILPNPSASKHKQKWLIDPGVLIEQPLAHLGKTSLLL